MSIKGPANTLVIKKKRVMRNNSEIKFAATAELEGEALFSTLDMYPKINHRRRRQLWRW